MDYLKNNFKIYINPLKAELNPICHLLALLGAHHILHVSRVRVKINIKIAPTCSGSYFNVNFNNVNFNNANFNNAHYALTDDGMTTPKHVRGVLMLILM